MIRETETLTYKQNMSRKELLSVIKAVGLPLLVFGIGLFTIASFDAFGSKLLCPMAGLMWGSGAIVAFIMPSRRHETINETLITTLIYFLTLLGLKVVLGLVSGVSAEQISASYAQAIPSSVGNALPGFVQRALTFLSVTVPFGFIAMQTKKLIQFRRNASLQKTLSQERGMLDPNRHNKTRI